MRRATLAFSAALLSVLAAFLLPPDEEQEFEVVPATPAYCLPASEFESYLDQETGIWKN